MQGTGGRLNLAYLDHGTGGANVDHGRQTPKIRDDLAQKFEMPGIPDFMQRDDVARTYEQMTGRSLQSLDWFEVFAALRFAVVSIRTSTRGIAYGTMEKPDDPDDLVMFRSLLEQMLDGTYWS